MEFLTDIFSQLKQAQGSAKAAEGKAQPAGLRVMTLGDALEISVPSASSRLKVANQVIDPIITKLIRTPDIATLRMATISDRVAVLRNTQTPFLNFLESQPSGVGQAFDYQYRFDEWNIGADVAEAWNIEDALPSEASSMRPSRNNTLTCTGNKIAVSLMVQEMANTQRNIDVLAREIDLEITRIRRKMNSMLLSNTEVKIEQAGSVPQLGGFLTRSTSYTVDAGGSDLTRSLIQTQVDSIANNADPQGLGYNLPLIAFTNARQLQVLRDIIISEYNGIDPMSRVAFEQELKGRLADFRVPVQMVFEPMPGPVIPFVLDSQLPSGSTIIFDANQPRLVKMHLGGQPGPYVLQRPTEKLQSLNVIFDLFTLEDCLIVSRAKIVDHA